MTRILVLCALIAGATGARAHPHIFVDVSLRLISDDAGRIIGIGVTWDYDEYYSLLMLTDYEITPGDDGHVAAEDLAQLEGFDLENWPDWFDGALFVEKAGQPLALGPPRSEGIALNGDRIVTRHVRPLDPVAPDGLVIRPYDPSYYAALSLSGEITLPDHCTATVDGSDAEADTILPQAATIEDDADLFEELKPGIHFADTLRVTCGPSS